LVHYPVVCSVEKKAGDEVQCIPQLSLISRLTAVSRSTQIKQKCVLQNKHHLYVLSVTHLQQMLLLCHNSRFLTHRDIMNHIVGMKNVMGVNHKVNAFKISHNFPYNDDGVVLTKFSDWPEMLSKSCYEIFNQKNYLTKFFTDWLTNWLPACLMPSDSHMFRSHLCIFISIYIATRTFNKNFFV